MLKIRRAAVLPILIQQVATWADRKKVVSAENHPRLLTAFDAMQQSKHSQGVRIRY